VEDAYAEIDSPFPFELYRDEDALKIRAGTLYRIEDGVTEARPLEDTGGQPDESATVLAEIPATAEKKIWVEQSSEDITLESADAFPADRDDEIGVTWWPVGIVSTDAGANITELDQYLLGHIYQAVSGDALDERSIDRATISGEEKIEIKGWNALTDALPTYEPDDDDAIPMKKWDGSAYENVIGFATVAKLRLKLADHIADAAYYSDTINDPPTQTQVQNINDGLVSAVGKINALLAALEAAGIMPAAP
jgi:hypothetical protein